MEKYYAVFNQNKTQGIIVSEKQLAYEARKGSDTNCYTSDGEKSLIAIAFTEQTIEEDCSMHEVMLNFNDEEITLHQALNLKPKFIEQEHSKQPWLAFPNTSWGEEHKKHFGDKKGYVITARSKNNDRQCIATVINTEGLTDEELKANCKLITASPILLQACIEAEKHHQGAHSEIGAILREAIEMAQLP